MIRLADIAKIYESGDVETVALEKVNLEIKEGEFTAIIGPSGSGKSTLMHIIGLLDQPTSGKYYLDNQEVSHLSEDELALTRNQKIGFVFQQFNLLPRTSALKNVILPMTYAGVLKDQRKTKAEALLKLVELEDRLDHTPSQLSGGQQQRVAIARALALDPAIILADEPTGNLATHQSREIMNIFESLNQKGKTIIMITHEPAVAAFARRVITLRDGQIVDDRLNQRK